MGFSPPEKVRDYEGKAAVAASGVAASGRPRCQEGPLDGCLRGERMLPDTRNRGNRRGVGRNLPMCARGPSSGALGDSEGEPALIGVAPERPARGHRRNFAQALDTPRLGTHQDSRTPKHCTPDWGVQKGGKRKLEVGPMRTESVVLSVRSGPESVGAKGGTRAGRSVSAGLPALPTAAGLPSVVGSRDAACGRGRRLRVRGGSAPRTAPGFSSSPSHTARVRSRSVGAKGGTRTPTGVTPQASETCASTNSATFAGRQG